jgi:hypothetical protein
MSKTVFRYFLDFLGGQEKWLNDMAERGFRLKKCGKMTYTFDECIPGEYEYSIEFVGDKSYSQQKDYRTHLESMGFRSFTKNVNLNFFYGKMRWRPYAKGVGQIATSPGGFNKELLILEKKKDGKPFELHTDMSDKLNTYKTVRRTYLYAVLIMAGLGALTFIPSALSLSMSVAWALRIVVATFGVLFIVPTVKYTSLISRVKEESKIYE